MGKPSKLADLKLVNKYYPPTGITNYSYRSPKLDTTFPRERQVGRSSVGSDASVPDMVDDGESIIFADEDDKSFYHVSGAELWDKFWEDPFWEANAEEAKREADGITQKIIKRHASYPALIPSPDDILPKDQYFLERQEVEAEFSFPEPPAPCTWPLAVAEPPTSPRPVTPKVSYSLFPRQTPTPPAVLKLSPRKLNLTLCTTTLWPTPGAKDLSVSLNSPGGSSRVIRAHSDVSLPKGRSSWSLSALIIPASVSPSTPVVDKPSRKDSIRRASSQSMNQRQRFPIKVSRTRSDTLMSQSSTISAPQPTLINTSPQDISASTRPITQIPRPPRSPPGFGGRLSQPEALKKKIPPPLQLHRCMTDTEIPPYHQQQRQSHISSPVYSPVYARTNPSTPTMPQRPEPMPVSVFELDSDSDEEEETSFARRIARSFTSQKRTRSASAAPRSRKGQEVAKQQLKCAQAEPLGGPSSGKALEALGASVGIDHHIAKDPCPPRLRKQKSEVFTKVFWNRR